ncbi:23S rRNA (guanosine(2251)-2'-O)-methyltransferase RlmB [Candidatus Saganbacteria bacterium]|nr:23S rRNA (guanosine(2251)-2'-O)-methyltransferase RlmB [Candidatus Saganbacteria bacterium]
MSEMLIGRQPVLEALKAKKPINRILLSKAAGGLTEIIDLAKQARVIFEFVDKKALDRISQSSKNQGVVAFASAHEYVEVEDILAAAQARDQLPFIVLLDQIEDPHNLGAIIRSAEAAGAHGVVTLKRRAVGLTETVAKTSAGALMHLPVARVNNLNDVILKLKEQRIWVFGLDEEGEAVFDKADFKLPLALVVGGEGQGLSRLVRERCDFLVKIPMHGKVNSLNASVAAAIVMFEVARQRQK